MSGVELIIDDRCCDDLCASNRASWRLITDTVMGGVSSGTLIATVVQGVRCLKLNGVVSLENNGGFVQASLDLDVSGRLNASAYRGFEIEVFGNDEAYNLHLRSADTLIVWQSYRARFQARPYWQTIRLPFAEFVPYRIDIPLDCSRLCRLGVVAIGKNMQVDICIARISLFS